MIWSVCHNGSPHTSLYGIELWILMFVTLELWRVICVCCLQEMRHAPHRSTPSHDVDRWNDVNRELRDVETTNSFYEVRWRRGVAWAKTLRAVVSSVRSAPLQRLHTHTRTLCGAGVWTPTSEGHVLVQDSIGLIAAAGARVLLCAPLRADSASGQLVWYTWSFILSLSSLSSTILVNGMILWNCCFKLYCFKLYM